MAASKKTDSEREQEIFIAQVRDVLRTKAGKRFVWDILSHCGLNSNSFTGNSHTFYNEGRRGVGLYVLDLLEQADPSIYPNLILEQIKAGDKINGS